MSTPRDGSMRRDILSAYAASASRVLSWVIVSALVYRRSHEAFAMLALVRGTIGILNYAALGLMPAMIREMALACALPKPAIPLAPLRVDSAGERPVLAYVTPDTTREDSGRKRTASYLDDAAKKIYATGLGIAWFTAILGVIATLIGANNASRIFNIPPDASTVVISSLVLFFGWGIAIRWLGDPAGAALQTHRRIGLDNIFCALTEIFWVVLTYLAVTHYRVRPLPAVGIAFFIASLFLVAARWIAARSYVVLMNPLEKSDRSLLSPLLATGLLITLAQLADYLYSPTDYLLINHLLTPLDLTHYAPAVQIDSGLLLLVTALGSVLLPKTALAHAAGNRAVVRTYYLRGTLASAALLIAASAVIYLASPWIFRLWFGERMPGTVAILPLVLLNTIIGGSSAVGRAILIGIGRAKPFTIAVLIAGVTNVVCSYCFVRYLGWGLNGIILGTIVAVVARCGVWMPWYVLRELKKGELFDLQPRSGERL